MTLTQSDHEVVFRFGQFELFPSRRLLRKEGRVVKLGSRAFDLLVALVEKAGQVVTKNELFARVWTNMVVEDANLRVHVFSLRRLLGDDGLESRYIVHVARRGYVFVAPLDPADRPTADTCRMRPVDSRSYELPRCQTEGQLSHFASPSVS